MMKDRFIENGIEYVRNSDYYLPDFEIPQCEYEIGKFGRLRKHYLKTNKACRYSTLLMTGKLFEHLHEVDEQAQAILEQFIKAAEKTAPDKEAQQMEWVRHMNSAKASANEVINHELIYV